MRLGLRSTVFQKGSEWSRVKKLYGGAPIVWERHRHRYEVEPKYVEKLTEAGIDFIGKDEKGERMQILELKGTPRERGGQRCHFTFTTFIPQITPTSLGSKHTLSSALAPSIRPHHSSDLSPLPLILISSRNSYKLS
jgi:CTP synthase